MLIYKSYFVIIALKHRRKTFVCVCADIVSSRTQVKQVKFALVQTNVIKHIRVTKWLSSGSKGIINLPWSSLNSGSHKKSLWAFLWQPLTFCFEKNCLCYLCLGDEGSILAYIIVSTSMARPTVMKNQGNQFSQYSDVTNSLQVSSSAYFPQNMALKYKMKLSEGSWDKILHSRSRTLWFWKEDFFFFFFFSGGLSLGAIDQSSGSSFRDFFVKTSKES